MSLGENVLAPKRRRGFSKKRTLRKPKTEKPFSQFCGQQRFLEKNFHLPHLVLIVYCSDSTATTAATATTTRAATLASTTTRAATATTTRAATATLASTTATATTTRAAASTMASATAEAIAGLKIMM